MRLMFIVIVIVPDSQNAQRKKKWKLPRIHEEERKKSSCKKDGQKESVTLRLYEQYHIIILLLH